MPESVAKPHEVGQFDTPSSCHRIKPSLIVKGHFDVLDHGELRDQIVRLKNEADSGGSNGGELVVRHLRNVISPEVEIAIGGAVETSKQIKEGTLAGT